MRKIALILVSLTVGIAILLGLKASSTERENLQGKFDLKTQSERAVENINIGPYEYTGPNGQMIYMVNSTADRSDHYIFDEICNTGHTVTRSNGNEEPECTLRAALQNANRHRNVGENTNLEFPDEIKFDIPTNDRYYVSNRFYIRVGNRNTGHPGPQTILPPISDPVSIIGPEHNGQPYIIITDSLLNGGDVGLLINESNKSKISNLAINSFMVGIQIEGSTNNTISNSHINNNSLNGVLINNSSGNTISNNEIKTNYRNGIKVDSGGVNNMIADNKINDNMEIGVLLSGSNNIIGGNTINHNNTNGIKIYNASYNLISGNEISENLNSGVLFENSNHNNLINNEILWNLQGGIQMQSSNSNNIYELRIENSGSQGIDADGIKISNSHNNTFSKNSIGHSSESGINISSSTYNLVSENNISNNSKHGINIIDDASTGNQLNKNSIYDNGLLGINLGANGVLRNDHDCLDCDNGPNDLQNYPVITSVSRINNIQLNVQGYIISTPGAKPHPSSKNTHLIEFYSNETQDESRYGEGYEYLDDIEISTHPLSGKYDFDVNINAPSRWSNNSNYLTATATDLNSYNTSEFSQAVPIN